MSLTSANSLTYLDIARSDILEIGILIIIIMIYVPLPLCIHGIPLRSHWLSNLHDLTAGYVDFTCVRPLRGV